MVSVDFDEIDKLNNMPLLEEAASGLFDMKIHKVFENYATLESLQRFDFLKKKLF